MCLCVYTQTPILTVTQRALSQEPSPQFTSPQRGCRTDSAPGLHRTLGYFLPLTESQFPQGQKERTELCEVHSGSSRHQRIFVISGMSVRNTDLPGISRLAEVSAHWQAQRSVVWTVATVREKAFSRRQGNMRLNVTPKKETLNLDLIRKCTYLTATLVSHGPVNFGNFFIWILQKLT